MHCIARLPFGVNAQNYRVQEALGGAQVGPIPGIGGLALAGLPLERWVENPLKLDLWEAARVAVALPFDFRLSHADRLRFSRLHVVDLDLLSLGGLAEEPPCRLFRAQRQLLQPEAHLVATYSGPWSPCPAQTGPACPCLSEGLG